MSNITTLTTGELIKVLQSVPATSKVKLVATDEDGSSYLIICMRGMEYDQENKTLYLYPFMPKYAD